MVLMTSIAAIDVLKILISFYFYRTHINIPSLNGLNALVKNIKCISDLNGSVYTLIPESRAHNTNIHDFIWQLNSFSSLLTKMAPIMIRKNHQWIDLLRFINKLIYE